ncbi:hypothetical protein PRZ48_003479 [Zasmidium cellare]|uniref:Uncharacterized protein n=1 Tax=Zasmidium cellare TaxID=395010 RepID=A0ABR0EV56_ZASCE|nr:hypothetical protein PRZ48_003479 [Zasmidium cellare]
MLFNHCLPYLDNDYLADSDCRFDLSTTFVLTSTEFSSTVTSVTTAFTTTTSTSTVTSTSTGDLSFCTAPALRKRSVENGTLRQRGRAPKPGCFGGYNVPSAISITATTARISTITSPRTATQTSPVTQTSVSTSTTTIVSTVFATQTTTVFQVISSTPTIQTDTTTTSTTTSTSTAVSTQTATVPSYSNFALQASFNGQFGSIHDSVGGSGQGVYFDKTDKSTAATFAFQGTKLYYNDQYVQSYAAASDNYFAVVDRPFAQFGYATDCTLNMPSFSGDGCVLDCQVDEVGFTVVRGNDVDNYGGAWGFQGDNDRFTVYAVGQT